jgi:Mg-chelatase subunit ChlD
VLGATQPHAVRRVESGASRMQRRAPGRRSKSRTSRKQGRYITSRVPLGRLTDLALDATLRAAAPFQPSRRAPGGRRVVLERQDLREKVRVRRTRNAVCFVVDASWSMAAEARMQATKAAVLSLLRDAYQRRDRVGLVSFGRDRATVLLPLTNSVELAQRRLAIMPSGGKTPLSRGLVVGYEMLARARLRDPEVLPLLVILTDGHANVAMTTLPPQQEAYRVADFIASQEIPAVVIDTELPNFYRGLARELAQHLAGSYFRLEDLQGGAGLAELVRSQMRLAAHE